MSHFPNLIDWLVTWCKRMELILTGMHNQGGARNSSLTPCSNHSSKLNPTKFDRGKEKREGNTQVETWGEFFAFSQTDVWINLDMKIWTSYTRIYSDPQNQYINRNIEQNIWKIEVRINFLSISPLSVIHRYCCNKCPLLLYIL